MLEEDFEAHRQQAADQDHERLQLQAQLAEFKELYASELEGLFEEIALEEQLEKTRNDRQVLEAKQQANEQAQRSLQRQMREDESLREELRQQAAENEQAIATATAIANTDAAFNKLEEDVYAIIAATESRSLEELALDASPMQAVAHADIMFRLQLRSMRDELNALAVRPCLGIDLA
jgi:hypothetical protein